MKQKQKLSYLVYYCDISTSLFKLPLITCWRTLWACSTSPDPQRENIMLKYHLTVFRCKCVSPPPHPFPTTTYTTIQVLLNTMYGVYVTYVYYKIMFSANILQLYMMVQKTTYNSCPLSLGPIPSVRLKNLGDIDK